MDQVLRCSAFTSGQNGRLTMGRFHRPLIGDLAAAGGCCLTDSNSANPYAAANRQVFEQGGPATPVSVRRSQRRVRHFSGDTSKQPTLPGNGKGANKPMRKLVLSLAVLVLPVGLLATVGANAASAGANVTGTGLVNCTKITGTISFKPALKLAPAQTVTTTIVSTATGCTGGTPKVVSSTSKSTSKKANQTCANLQGTNAANFTTTYVSSPPGVAGSTFKGTSSSNGATGNQHAGFKLKGTVSGSYKSTTTTATATLQQTVNQIIASCSGTGLSKLNIISGTIKNG
jgi:hypothetical protein